MNISQEALDFLRAQDEEKKCSEALRAESAIKIAERLSRQNYRISNENYWLKGCLLLSSIVNAALIGWVIL